MVIAVTILKKEYTSKFLEMMNLIKFIEKSRGRK